eukprot:TRINITY_DN19946_c0_g1_i1.p1 TRINITY_DN19946_c0_g1~~TRINITY_DN19946_c0_g1_i1.p1  ORF type:complete len:234 (+),score=33.61 TRINITY_DN19946_c0_g1_i1:555-1256(+)
MSKTFDDYRLEGEIEVRLQLKSQRKEMEQEWAASRSCLGEAALARRHLSNRLQEQGGRLARTVVCGRRREADVRAAVTSRRQALTEKEIVESQCKQLQHKLSALRAELQEVIEEEQLRASHLHSSSQAGQPRLAIVEEGGVQSEIIRHFDICSDTSIASKSFASGMMYDESCAALKVRSRPRMFETEVSTSSDQRHHTRSVNPDCTSTSLRPPAERNVLVPGEVGSVEEGCVT